jgi:hypothetical protein
MSDEKPSYPLATLHQFLQEAAAEFNRFRLQAKVNLIGSLVLLLFLSRFLVFAFGNYGPPPFNMRPFTFERQFRFDFEFADWVLLLASLAAVVWSVYVFVRQRSFVSRWGKRFEKLDSLEKKFLPEESS